MRSKKNEFIGQSHNKFLQTARDFDKVCPKCNNVHITTRTRKTPKNKCDKCGNEFDNPKAKSVYRTSKQKREFNVQYSNPYE